MTLEFLVLLVVVGIATIVGAVHVSGVSRKQALALAEDAVEIFGLDYPEANAVKAYLTHDNSAAFLDLKEGGLGLVEVFGARYITRWLKRGDVRSVESFEIAGLKVTYGDFTKRQGIYEMGSVEVRDTVLRKLEHLADKAAEAR